MASSTERRIPLSEPSPPPRIPALLRALDEHGVDCVVNGSVAAIAHGLALTPSDLDLAPDLAPPNLVRVAGLLTALGAKPKYFGHGKGGPTRAECEAWTPEPPTAERLDHRFVTPLGELDVVPSNAGRFAVLRPRAHRVRAFDIDFLVAHPDDVIAYWRRWGRPKDLERAAALTALAAGGIDPGAAALERRLSLGRDEHHDERHDERA